MKKSFLIIGIALLSSAQCSSQAFAWGDCGSIRIPLPGSLNNLSYQNNVNGGGFCGWVATVNDDKMNKAGGIAGQYFCGVTVQLRAVKKGRKYLKCQGTLTATLAGNGIYGGTQACVDLFGFQGNKSFGVKKVC